MSKNVKLIDFSYYYDKIILMVIIMNKKDKINVIFLDYDGVISIEKSGLEIEFENPEAIWFISKLCLEKNFKIVVSSTWRNHPKYKEMLYDQGLDEDVEIIGCTENGLVGRDAEIKEYLLVHNNIDKFIIIDDADFDGELKNHLVQTSFNRGFNKQKYLEALELIDKL